MAKYYAIQVKTGQEKKIKLLIEKCYGKMHKKQGIKLIIPQGVVNDGKKGYCSVLPGYILLKCNEFTNELYYQLKNTIGVYRVLLEDIAPNEITAITEKTMKCVLDSISAAKHYFRRMFNKMFKKNKVVKAKLPTEIIFWPVQRRLLN